MPSTNPRSNSRPLSASRSFQQSFYAPGASSRPFLNMLNPLGLTYQGYSAANQSLLEEDEEDSRSHAHQDDVDDDDVEAQARNGVRWTRGAEMSTFRPNIHREDKIHEESESDDEVPQSFMIESPSTRRPPAAARLAKGKPRETRIPAAPSTFASGPGVAPISTPPRPSELNPEYVSAPSPSPHPPRQMSGLDAYERALWNWVNVYNLDAFLQEVYYYYEGKGIYSIALARGLNLLSVPSSFFTPVVCRVWIISFVTGTMRLVDMYRFYTYLLRIPDEDIQTISWPEIVRRIAAIRDSNPLTAVSSRPRDADGAKLDAHDIANRIMRQENYLIALFNKEVLDLRVPLPAGLDRIVAPEEGKGRTLTRALEWNLRFCLMEYLFDPRGRVRKIFLKSKNRAALINGLDESYPTANMYIGQFPNEKVAIIMRFVAFVAGSFAAVLFLASVLDPDLFLHLEITPHRTVLFYLSVFGGVLAVARGMIPEENRVFDSEMLMMEVVNYTHYMPDDWKDKLHSKKASRRRRTFFRESFGELFSMKIVTFGKEIVSVVLTPFILWFSLPECAPAIVDFFREFTVHVDGLGYVCSFAVFDFQRHGNVKFGAPTQVKDERLMSKEGKMEKSFLNFKAAHPDWVPSNPSGSLYLTRMADLT
ncbi:hypothetical protein EW146_g8357, partial [Bondarzewia mesenterica]